MEYVKKHLARNTLTAAALGTAIMMIPKITYRPDVDVNRSRHPPSDIPMRSAEAPNAPYHVEKAPYAPLRSAWGNATCMLEDGRLSYSDKGNTASIELDIKPAKPMDLLCSAKHTVIVEPEEARIIVSIGGAEILQGTLILGFVFDRITIANSYSVNISDIVSEPIVRQGIEGDQAVFVTSKKRWTLDLSNPTEWNIYDK